MSTPVSGNQRVVQMFGFVLRWKDFRYISEPSVYATEDSFPVFSVEILFRKKLFYSVVDDNFILPGGATSRDSFLKACKTSEKRSSFLYEGFGYSNKLQNTELPP